MVRDGPLDMMEPSTPAPAPLKPKKRRKGEAHEMLDFEPEEIARQLTLIDWKFASEVKLKEMLRSRWIKSESPKLDAASNRVNDVAYWIANQIVTTPTQKKRVQILIHVIKIAKHLILMNSFNSLMAIYLACNFASVARLTQTWKAVPAKHFQMYQKICQLMSPKHNFKAYRTFVEDKYVQHKKKKKKKKKQPLASASLIVFYHCFQTTSDGFVSRSVLEGFAVSRRWSRELSDRRRAGYGQGGRNRPRD